MPGIDTMWLSTVHGRELERLRVPFGDGDVVDVVLVEELREALRVGVGGYTVYSVQCGLLLLPSTPPVRA